MGEELRQGTEEERTKTDKQDDKGRVYNVTLNKVMKTVRGDSRDVVQKSQRGQVETSHPRSVLVTSAPPPPRGTFKALSQSPINTCVSS